MRRAAAQSAEPSRHWPASGLAAREPAEPCLLRCEQRRSFVQDSVIGEHPIAPGRGPGPWEAVEDFMKQNNHFIIDKERERFLLTNNSNRFIKRVR
jgi:cephalosporin hydroxylase